MVVIWFLVSILLILLILISVVPLKILFDSDENLDFHINITWLKSSLKGIIQNKDTYIFLTVYLFNKRILTRQIKAKSKNKQESRGNSSKVYYFRQLKPNYMYIDTEYGFKDPSTTGILYGIINSISEFLNLENMYNEADFTAEKDYFNINGIIKLNIASTAFKLLKSYRKSHTLRKVAY